MPKTPELRSQRRNANKHTPRGSSMLARSVEQDGWLGAITTAADGEVIDGSLRLETAFPVLDAEPIIIRTDGTRPIVHIREDIPNADTEQARRLSIKANRVAEVSLNWDEGVLKEWKEDIDLDECWNPAEFEELLNELEEAGGDGGEGDDEPFVHSGDRFPLPIVLSWAEKREWDVIKETLGTKSDKTAFLKLMRGEK